MVCDSQPWAMGLEPFSYIHCFDPLPSASHHAFRRLPKVYRSAPSELQHDAEVVFGALMIDLSITESAAALYPLWKRYMKQPATEIGSGHRDWSS